MLHHSAAARFTFNLLTVQTSVSIPHALVENFQMSIHIYSLGLLGLLHVSSHQSHHSFQLIPERNFVQHQDLLLQLDTFNSLTVQTSVSIPHALVENFQMSIHIYSLGLLGLLHVSSHQSHHSFQLIPERNFVQHQDLAVFLCHYPCLLQYIQWS